MNRKTVIVALIFMSILSSVTAVIVANKVRTDQARAQQEAQRQSLVQQAEQVRRMTVPPQAASPK